MKWKGKTLPHRAERVQKLINNIYIVYCVWTKPDEKQGLILRVLSFKRRIHQLLSPEPCYVPQLGHRRELSAFRLGRCGQDTGNQCAADGGSCTVLSWTRGHTASRRGQGRLPGEAALKDTLGAPVPSTALTLSRHPHGVSRMNE